MMIRTPLLTLISGDMPSRTLRSRNVRSLFLWGAGVAVLGLAAFWFITIPATVPTRALGPHTPDLANGKAMFLIGGLLFLPRRAQAREQHEARWRARPRFVVWNILRPQYLPRYQGRHWRMDRVVLLSGVELPIY